MYRITQLAGLDATTPYCANNGTYVPEARICCPPGSDWWNGKCVCRDPKRRIKADLSACMCIPPSTAGPGGECLCPAPFAWDQLDPSSGAESCVCPREALYDGTGCRCIDPKKRFANGGCTCAAPGTQGATGCECPGGMEWMPTHDDFMACKCPDDAALVDGQCPAPQKPVTAGFTLGKPLYIAGAAVLAYFLWSYFGKPAAA